MVETIPQLQRLEERIQPLRDQLARHPLYRAVGSVDDIRTFMESHVFAVWDFMSLLKTLQRGLTSVQVPWMPSPHPEACRLINEIVLGEESDSYQGQAVSHFELYVRAMRESGASTAPIEDLLIALGSGMDLERALQKPNIPACARAFVEETFVVIREGKLHCTAAAFTFGREDLIPEIFQGLVRELNHQKPGKLRTFLWYLERHIEVDGEEHGPMALRMVATLCGDEEERWREAGDAAETALRARKALWDGIVAQLERVPSAAAS